MSDMPLPAFLDSLLSYLDEHLPPELYLFISSFLSHSLALLNALVSLVSSVVASKPWDWDAQTIIPPLISFLAAYLALVSLYRTTSWLFRTTFWFIKWGTILGILAAGAGWYIGNHDLNGAGRGPLSTVGAVLSALNGGRRDGADPRSSETTSRTARRRTKPWESFDADQWQYREGKMNRAENDAQQIMSDIVAAANRILMEGEWWDAAKGVFSRSDPRHREERRSTKRQTDRSTRR